MKLSNNKVIFSLFILLAFTFIASLVWGQIDISFNNFFSIIANKLNIGGSVQHNFSEGQEAVLWYIRMPRTIVGVLVGAALGVSGAVMQGVFGNPLADPGIIGVSAGATTGAVIAIALGLTTINMFFLPGAALIGSICSVTITVFLAMRQGRVPVMTLLLSGVAVGMLLSAVTSGILTVMSDQKLQQYLFWMVGGLDYRRWEHVYLAIGPILLGIAIMWLLARHINILVLGDTEAKAVGMPVLKLRLLLLFLAALTTATAVSVSGNIGFVGLVVPHIMRLLVGPDHRILIPTSALA